MQESTGFQRTLSGQYSANVGAWLVSSAWAHRWWAPYLSAPSEALFPGILAIVLGMLGRVIVLRSSTVRRRQCDVDDPRDVAVFYIGLAIFTSG